MTSLVPVRPTMTKHHIVDAKTDLPLCGYNPWPALNFAGPAVWVTIEEANAMTICAKCRKFFDAQRSSEQQEMFS